MHERSIKSWWQRRLPDISAAASRFPLAVAIAAALTAYKLYHGSMIGDAEFRVMAWLAASFVWVVSVDLYCGEPTAIVSGTRSAVAPRRGSAWRAALARYRHLAERRAAGREPHVWR